MELNLHLVLGWITKSSYYFNFTNVTVRFRSILSCNFSFGQCTIWNYFVQLILFDFRNASVKSLTCFHQDIYFCNCYETYSTVWYFQETRKLNSRTWLRWLTTTWLRYRTNFIVCNIFEYIHILSLLIYLKFHYILEYVFKLFYTKNNFLSFAGLGNCFLFE